MELESQADEIRDRGNGIAVISYDPQEVTSSFTEANGISFPMLSDVGSETIRRFGILNPVPEWAFGEDASTRSQPVVIERLPEQFGFFHVKGFEPAVAGVAEAFDIEAGRSWPVGKLDGQISTWLSHRHSGLDKRSSNDNFSQSE